MLTPNEVVVIAKYVRAMVEVAQADPEDVQGAKAVALKALEMSAELAHLVPLPHYYYDTSKSEAELEKTRNVVSNAFDLLITMQGFTNR